MAAPVLRDGDRQRQQNPPPRRSARLVRSTVTTTTTPLVAGSIASGSPTSSSEEALPRSTGKPTKTPNVAKAPPPSRKRGREAEPQNSATESESDTEGRRPVRPSVTQAKANALKGQPAETIASSKAAPAAPASARAAAAPTARAIRAKKRQRVGSGSEGGPATTATPFHPGTPAAAEPALPNPPTLVFGAIVAPNPSPEIAMSVPTLQSDPTEIRSTKRKLSIAGEDQFQATMANNAPRASRQKKRRIVSSDEQSVSLPSLVIVLSFFFLLLLSSYFYTAEADLPDITQAFVEAVDDAVEAQRIKDARRAASQNISIGGMASSNDDNTVR